MHALVAAVVSEASQSVEARPKTSAGKPLRAPLRHVAPSPHEPPEEARGAVSHRETLGRVSNSGFLFSIFCEE